MPTARAPRHAPGPLPGTRFRPAAAILFAALAFTSGCCTCDNTLAPSLACIEGQNTLGAILGGEQVYYQKYGTYVNAATYAGFSDTLKLVFNHVDDRWILRVSAATDSSYVATVTGRSGTPADGMHGQAVYLRSAGYPSWTWVGGGCDFTTGDRPSCAEGKGGLGAIQTGEQVYFQQHGTYLNVAENAGFADTLHVDLSDLEARWEYSVRDASDSGYVAMGFGRPGTSARGLAVSMIYSRRDGARVNCLSDSSSIRTPGG